MLVCRKCWSQEQTFQVNSVRPDQIFDPGLKILVLAFTRHVSNQGVICIQKAARMKGSSDVEGDLVGEVYEYLVSGKYCDGASRERKRAIRKKALKFSVLNKGELFHRQKRTRQVPYMCHRQWSYFIDSCVFAYNTSRLEATKHTPFSLRFG